MEFVDSLVFLLTFLTLLACCLMAGLFFAFSICVIKALGRLPAAEGIAAMQAINVAIINPVFLTVFIGAAGGCVLVMLAALWRWPFPGALVLVLGSGTYLLGCLLVTIAANIPKNDRLSTLAPNDPRAAGYWSHYLSTWSAWNQVRTFAALAAVVLLIVGLCQ